MAGNVRCGAQAAQQVARDGRMRRAPRPGAENGGYCCRVTAFAFWAGVAGAGQIRPAQRKSLCAMLCSEFGFQGCVRRRGANAPARYAGLPLEFASKPTRLHRQARSGASAGTWHNGSAAPGCRAKGEPHVKSSMVLHLQETAVVKSQQRQQCVAAGARRLDA